MSLLVRRMVVFSSRLTAVAVIVLLANTTTGIKNESQTAAAVGTVSFVLVTNTISECDIGLSNGGIAILEYRQLNLVGNGDNDDNSGKISWKQLDKFHLPDASNYTANFTSNFTYDCKDLEGDSPLVQFRLVQWEHGGGYCNCWGVQGSWEVRAEEKHISL